MATSSPTISSRRRKLKIAFWLLLNVAALLGLIWMGAALYTQHKGAEQRSLAEGKKVIISLPQGTVTGGLLPSSTMAESAEPAFKADEADVDELIEEDEEDGPTSNKSVTAPIPESSIIASSTDKPAVAEEPFTPAATAKVAIIVMGLGLSKSTTEDVLSLPDKVSLSFSPYASDVKDWLKKASDKGFTTLIDLPLEPIDYPLSDPGPLALLTTANEATNLKQLEKLLALSDKTSGFLGPMSEKFTDDIKFSKPLIEALGAKKRLFIYTPTSKNTYLSALQDQGVIPQDIVIDEVISNDAIEDKLLGLENIAREKGSAIAIAHPYPLTINLLKAWLGNLQLKGVEIIDVSKLSPTPPLQNVPVKESETKEGEKEKAKEEHE